MSGMTPLHHCTKLLCTISLIYVVSLVYNPLEAQQPLWWGTIVHKGGSLSDGFLLTW